MSTINRIPQFAILCLVLLHEVEVCLAHPIPIPGANQAIKKGAQTNETALHQIPIVPFLGPRINCKEQCFGRCNLALRYRMCFRVCNTCCQRCNCVPALGTSVSPQACPCWNSMSHRGRIRCP